MLDLDRQAMGDVPGVAAWKREKSIPFAEELELVPVLGPEKTTNVGTKLSNDKKECLTKFL